VEDVLELEALRPLDGTRSTIVATKMVEVVQTLLSTSTTRSSSTSAYWWTRRWRNLAASASDRARSGASHPASARATKLSAKLVG
jgi:hypothetical protein